jgi:hypothetical protein
LDRKFHRTLQGMRRSSGASFFQLAARIIENEEADVNAEMKIILK